MSTIYVYYIIYEYKERIFLRLKKKEIGPFKYLDLGSDFFFIIIPEFELKLTTKLDLETIRYEFLIINKRQISPFKLYLYLKPLYSILGGSTTRAEPFIKNPNLVDFLQKPLYK
jgi:hypothetical protein